ncbi:hypothetical protein B0I35DRAFT_188402 [Stachybotrys elegans]|uniref:Uncharacterized protein n=1 Tax=Stachybotrys elegans TaxID=80388 RepID=A0A8K0WTG9_9HYPO|nr:hypothetical protein B0I35DRAFT_188402 [Stachybotrys elegans]
MRFQSHLRPGGQHCGLHPLSHTLRSRCRRRCPPQALPFGGGGEGLGQAVAVSGQLTPAMLARLLASFLLALPSLSSIVLVPACPPAPQLHTRPPDLHLTLTELLFVPRYPRPGFSRFSHPHTLVDRTILFSPPSLFLVLELVVVANPACFTTHNLTTHVSYSSAAVRTAATYPFRPGTPRSDFRHTREHHASSEGKATACIITK